MTRYRHVRYELVGILSLIALVALSANASAQTVKKQGLIKGRSGATLILQASGSETVNVVLTDETQVDQVKGVLKARRKEMSMAALIPGLAVQVEGTYDDQHQLVAKSVKFKGDDLKRAQAIQAGMHETKAQAQVNTDEIAKQNEAMQRQGQQVAANQAAIDAAVARFGQLDDYYIFDQVTVYFGNGQTDIEPKYQPQLLALAEKAKKIQAYTIEVKGYASSVGSAEVNQRLSEDRAHNVTNVLLQQGNIPLTHMLAPGAMGESHQVGNESTAEGQAENRRVVVRVLQNKGVAGSKGPAK